MIRNVDSTPCLLHPHMFVPRPQYYSPTIYCNYSANISPAKFTPSSPAIDCQPLHYHQAVSPDDCCVCLLFYWWVMESLNSLLYRYWRGRSNRCVILKQCWFWLVGSVDPAFLHKSHIHIYPSNQSVHGCCVLFAVDNLIYPLIRYHHIHKINIE